jgi:uncharacterized protein (TIRG00374 family)
MIRLVQMISTSKLPALKSSVRLLVKVILVMGLFWFLWKKRAFSMDNIRSAFSQEDGHVWFGLAAIIFGNLLVFVRWHLLILAQGITISLWQTIRYSLIGFFFNLALPGSVSGDFVKAFYLSKQDSGNTARAAGSILMDRVIGVSALAWVAAAAVIFGSGNLPNNSAIETLRIAVLVCALGAVFFYGYLFFLPERHDPVLKVLQSIEKRTGKIEFFVRTYECVKGYCRYRSTVVSALSLSFAIQLAVGWGCWQFALALGDVGLPLFGVYLVVPIGMLAAAVPLFPGGIGTGHAAFLFLFQLVGSNRGADIFSLLFLSGLLMSVTGGFLYLGEKKIVRTA